MSPRLKLTITRTRRRTVTLPVALARPIYCPECGREAVTVSRAQAMQLLGITEDGLDDLSAVGQAHLVQTIAGPPLICKDSLFPDRGNHD